LASTEHPVIAPRERTFRANHVQDLVSIDFVTVPPRLRVLFVLVVLAHHRARRPL
jgi:hypothetical protein